MKRKSKNPVGRPPHYKTAAALQEKIKLYFSEGFDIKKVIVGSGRDMEVVEMPVYTISGLVLYCGFADRQAFYKLEKRKEFSYTIKRARETIAQQYEMMIATGQGQQAGAIFALKNFGWSDKLEIEHGLADSFFEKYEELNDDELETRYREICGYTHRN